MAARYRLEAQRLKGALEQSWDGEWYRRAYFDDGTPLGSAVTTECQIDSIAQSWAVLSGAAPVRHAERAMDAVRSRLIRRDAQVLLLLTPPFDRGVKNPGYIKAYPPGIRENGGQYTHAALWTVMALAKLGYGDEAVELFHMLNPINHTRDAAAVARYTVEPYVVAADVYAHPQHAGRGGWTWYTASARPDVSSGNREHPGPSTARGGLHGRPVHPRGVAGVSSRVAVRHEPLSHPRGQRRPVQLRRVAGRSRRRCGGSHGHSSGR